MTNFDFLKKDSQFHTFSDVAINAEKVFAIDFDSSAVNARRAMEFAVKWLYSVDSSLVIPTNPLLINLLSTYEFKKLLDKDMFTRLKFIQEVGNHAAHNPKKITKGQAFTSLLNLFIFLDFVALCYSKSYEKTSFKPSLLESHILQNNQVKDLQNIQESHEIELEKLLQENKTLKEKLTKRRELQEKDYIPKPLDLSEHETRKIYIDTMLMDLGWVQGTNWINEVRVSGMPNNANEGFVDYILYDALPSLKQSVQV